MAASVINYAVVLHQIEADKDSIFNAKKILDENDDLVVVFSDPRIDFAVKEKIIDRVFSREISSFIKVMVKHNKVKEFDAICEEYKRIAEEEKKELSASVLCVVPPSEEQKERIKSFLLKEFNATKIKLTVEKDESLIGGFIIRCGDMEYDRSYKGRLDALSKKLIGEVK